MTRWNGGGGSRVGYECVLLACEPQLDSPTPRQQLQPTYPPSSSPPPLPTHNLQTWVQTPAIYVFDCSAAGQILNSFKQFMFQRQQEAEGYMSAQPYPHALGGPSGSAITPSASSAGGARARVVELIPLRSVLERMKESAHHPLQPAQQVGL